MSADLTFAVELQRAGRYADAARLYHDVLRREPDHPDALHLFGVMHYQCGHSDRAVEMVGLAVTLRPRAAAFHANLSEILRSLGRNDEAAESAREAIRLDPDYAEAANNLGLALQALGRYEEGADAFRTALRLRPDFALARNNLGTVLNALERADEAFDAFQHAVELDPTLALARANLGQMLIDRGRTEEGLEHCLEAVRLQPSLAAAHNSLGNAYRAGERWPEARVAYAEALRLTPEIAAATVHSNLGVALHEQGDDERAFSCLRRATELAPDDPVVWRNLASVHADREDYQAAIPCCEKVVALAPTRASDQNNLGWALQQEGRLEEAADRYRRALEIDPNHVDALLNRGNLHEEVGEMAEAEACYRRVLDTACAPAALARLATLLRGRLPEGERAAIRARLLDADLGEDPRISLLFGLAHVSDAHGDCREAADALKQANALSMARRIRRHREYDPAEHVQFVDRLIAGFSREFVDRLAGAGDPSRQPVFVLGMPRSGTTLVEQVLASHPQIHGAGELRRARQSFEEIPRIVGRAEGFFECLDSLDADGVRAIAARHLAELRRIAGDAADGPAPERIVDKMPDNYLYLGLLAVLFPRATFIHVRRDPRDVALSCWMTSFRTIRWANDVDHIAARFGEHRRLMDHWRAVLPMALHQVVYEELVDDFECEAKRLIGACGLPWDPACLEFHATERPVRTASVTQVRQPLYRRSLGRWRRYETELNDLFSKLTID